MKIYKWIRVTKKRPCSVCGKPDYCTYAPEGELILCMRVESDRPSRNSMGGWLHSAGFNPPVYIAPAIRAAIQDPPLDADELWRGWYERTDREALDKLGISLGVDTDALSAIGCAWAGKEWQLDREKKSFATPAWAFPMFSAERQVIGVRLRSEDGRKWAVKGSHSGLFIPSYDTSAISESGTLWLVEGPTDLSAALTIGLAAIGRPSAAAQQDMILNYIRIWKVKRLVIVTDNDEPDIHGRVAGLAGATKLQESLPISSAILLPPCRDLRQFVNCGGDYLTAQSMLSDLVWTAPAVNSR